MPWRDATLADRDRLIALSLALYDEDPAGVPVTAAQVGRTLDAFAAEPTRGRAVVLDVDKQAVGYALLCAFWSNELGGEVCILDELYVARDHRGAGHATALIDALAHAQAPWFADAVAVELEVTPGNPRARALYERQGFRAYKNALMRRVRPRQTEGAR